MPKNKQVPDRIADALRAKHAEAIEALARKEVEVKEASAAVMNLSTQLGEHIFNKAGVRRGDILSGPYIRGKFAITGFAMSKDGEAIAVYNTPIPQGLRLSNLEFVKLSKPKTRKARVRA